MTSGHSKKDVEQWASLKDFIDALPFYVMIIDESHHIILANKAVSSDLGLDPEEIAGTFCPKTVHGLTHPYEGCPVEEAVEKGHSVEKEMFFSEYNKWFKSSAFLTNKLTNDGKRIYIHFVQDINEQRLAEEKLQSKIDELEKWQRMTVNREVRMTELKSEINTLKEEIKKLSYK